MSNDEITFDISQISDEEGAFLEVLQFLGEVCQDETGRDETFSMLSYFMNMVMCMSPLYTVLLASVLQQLNKGNFAAVETALAAHINNETNVLADFTGEPKSVIYDEDAVSEELDLSQVNTPPPSNKMSN